MDEIFTGFGRTGAMFGYQHDGIVADLIVVGMALGGGLPVALVAGSREVMSRIPPRRQTSTFSANPVACASGDTLATALAAISAPGVTVTVRGRGLMLGAHIAAPAGAAFVKRVAARMRESGVLALRGGASGQVVKLTPPLTLPPGAETVSL